MTGVWPRVLTVEMERRWVWDKFWRRADWAYMDRTWEVKERERSRMIPRLWLNTCLLGNLGLSPLLHCVFRKGTISCVVRDALI